MPPKRIVFIPGFVATELRAGNRTIFPPAIGDLLNGAKKKEIVEMLAQPRFDDPTDPVQPGEPIRSVFGPISKQADVLYKILQSFGYDTSAASNTFRAVGWDWRKAIDDTVTQRNVANAIRDLFAIDGRKIVALVHSTGGLVLRKLLEDEPGLAQKIDHILAFGVPWAGALTAIQGLDNPGKVGFWPVELSAAQIKKIMTNTQALYDLCPPDPAQTQMTSASGAPLNLFMENNAQASPLLRDVWMSEPFMKTLAAKANTRLGRRSAEIQLGGNHATPPITNVVAWGTTCIGQSELLPTAKIKYTTSAEQLGDGTVPLVSAAWIRGANVRTLFLPIGAYPTGNIPRDHPHIWDAPPVAQILDEVLDDAPRKPFIAVAADGNDFQNPTKRKVMIRIAAMDAAGRALPGCKVTLKFGAGRNPGVPLTAAFTAVELNRDAFRTNNPQRIQRLPIEVRWDGGKAERVVMFHVT